MTEYLLTYADGTTEVIPQADVTLCGAAERLVLKDGRVIERTAWARLSRLPLAGTEA